MKYKNQIFLFFIILIALTFCISLKNVDKRKRKSTNEIKNKVVVNILENKKLEVKKDSIKIKNKRMIDNTSEEVKIPQWFKKILLIYEENYEKWTSKKNSSIGEKESFEVLSRVDTTNIKSSSTTPLTEYGITPSIPQQILPSQNLRSQDSLTMESSSNIKSSSQYGIFAENIRTNKQNITEENKSSENEKKDIKEENTKEDIVVMRKIESNQGIKYVTLSVNFNTEVSGIIITENIPENYTVISASPMYSKKVGNSYKWLFYGKNIENRTIYYQLKGEGEGNITGNFNTSLGNGIIKGDTKI